MDGIVGLLLIKSPGEFIEFKTKFHPGQLKCYEMQWACQLSQKMRYEGVRFNVFSVIRGVGRGQISRKTALRNT